MAPEQSPKLFDLPGVEIFAAGTWNGDTYTHADLDAMVAAHAEIGKQIKPYLKLGHDPKQKLLQADGYPAAGWIDNLRRDGDKLVADFKAVPRLIKDLIERKAYGRFSSEIYTNLKHVSGKAYAFVLKAVALLGGDTPAVKTLNDFVNLYEGLEPARCMEETMDAEIKTIEFEEGKDHPAGWDKCILNMSKQYDKDRAYAICTKMKQEGKGFFATDAAESEAVEFARQFVQQEETMNEQEKAALEAKVAEAEAKAKEYSDQLASIEQAKKDAEAKLAHDALVEDVRAFCAKAVTEGKMLPCQVPYLSALALGHTLSDKDGVRTYSYVEGKDTKELQFKSNMDILKGLLEVAKPVLNFDEKSEDKAVDNRSPEDKLVEKANKYAVEHKVSFKDAVLAVADSKEE